VTFLEPIFEPWRDRAACVTCDVPHAIWIKPAKATRTQYAAMEQACATCPVKAECTADMDRHQDWVGFRAGTWWTTNRGSTHERRAVRRVPAPKLSSLPRPCLHCGRPYTLPPGIKTSVYCSPGCRAAGRLRTKREWWASRGGRA
jgi:hypothetical protein